VALKGIVDALDQPDVLVVLPLGLLFAYGMLRLSSSLFNELRDAVFARVRYHAIALPKTVHFTHLWMHMIAPQYM
jgi:ATP-binding cassette subfamily B protein